MRENSNSCNNHKNDKKRLCPRLRADKNFIGARVVRVAGAGGANIKRASHKKE